MEWGSGMDSGLMERGTQEWTGKCIGERKYGVGWGGKKGDREGEWRGNRDRCGKEWCRKGEGERRYIEER